MTSSIDNLGKVVVINETQAESIQTIKDILEEFGIEAPSDSLLISDWGIVGGETNAQLDEMVKDFASELHSERCAHKNAWRYQF